MSFPVLVEPCDNHQFSASLVGAPNVCAVEPTRFQAISVLEAEIHKRIEMGELLLLEIDNTGVSGIAGKYSTDPTLSEICDNAYQMRDAESNP